MVLAGDQMECRCSRLHTLMRRLTPVLRLGILRVLKPVPALRKAAQGLRKGTRRLSPALRKVRKDKAYLSHAREINTQEVIFFYARV